MRTKKSNGFTLIELLVVIAIIAILAAIIFPVFAKAREKARQISCASNMRQLGMGVIQYMEDYDEQMPGSINNSQGRGWGGVIYTYLKSTDVYGCPDDPTQPADSNHFKVSYGINSNLTGGYWTATVQGADTAIAAQNSPASTVLFFECQGVYNGGYGIRLFDTNPTENGSPAGNGAFVTATGLNNGKDAISSEYNGAVYATGNIGGYPVNNYNNTPYGVHSNGANYTALDGHVKFLLPNAVSGGNNAKHPTDAEVHINEDGKDFAAGTDSMTQQNASKVTLTFSAI